MGAPSVICQDHSGTATPGNPCHLGPLGEKEPYGDWQYLIQFEAQPPREGHVQRVGTGFGPINLDFYPVCIDVMPTFDGKVATKEVLFDQIRKNFKQLVTDVEMLGFYFYDGVLEKLGLPQSPHPVGKLGFYFYDGVDAKQWLADAPVGTMGRFAVGGGPSFEFISNPDCLDVVCSELVGADHWIFSTIYTPTDLGHPVSGNRQFGIAVRRPSDVYSSIYDHVFAEPVTDDKLYFYTRGTDRCATLADSVLAGAVFAGGHDCWVHVQKSVRAFVRLHGGEASVPGCISNREPWPDMLKAYGSVKQLAAPSAVPAVKYRSLGNKF